MVARDPRDQAFYGTDGVVRIELASTKGCRFADTAEQWASVWSDDRTGAVEDNNKDRAPIAQLFRELSSMMDIGRRCHALAMLQHGAR